MFFILTKSKRIYYESKENVFESCPFWKFVRKWNLNFSSSHKSTKCTSRPSLELVCPVLQEPPIWPSWIAIYKQQFDSFGRSSNHTRSSTFEPCKGEQGAEITGGEKAKLNTRRIFLSLTEFLMRTGFYKKNCATTGPKFQEVDQFEILTYVDFDFGGDLEEGWAWNFGGNFESWSWSWLSHFDLIV